LPPRNDFPIRLITHLPGRLLADTKPHSPALLHSLGHTLGQLDAALADFDHPAAHRTLKWNLNRASFIAAYLQFIPDASRSATWCAASSTSSRSTLSHGWPTCATASSTTTPTITIILTANQLDQRNLRLWRRAAHRHDQRTGHRRRLRHPAQARPAGGGRPRRARLPRRPPAHPRRSVAALLTHRHAPLRQRYDERLPALRRSRTTTICKSRPRPAWQTLASLAQTSPLLAEATFRHACGWEPVAKSAQVTDWLRENSGSFCQRVIDTDWHKVASHRFRPHPRQPAPRPAHQPR
jgi:hypothetical protein